MALNFPSSPSNGDTFEGYVYSSSTGTWDYNETTPDSLTLTTLTVSGTINANAITVAQQKNAAVVSGYNSASGSFAHASKVIMSANATASAAPTLRPDGTSLAAGDVWISW
jgi:hypothetical protein